MPDISNEEHDAPIVWQLIEPPPGVERDYSSCRGYGEMRTILKHEDIPSLKPQQCIEKLQRDLEDARDGDYFLLAGGDPITPLLAGMVLQSMCLRKIFWLRWDRRTNNQGERLKREGYYVPVELELPALPYSLLETFERGNAHGKS